MLTKLEITQKKARSEQLDLVETISTDDKLRQKRTFIIIAIMATIGLSLAFWVYRTIRSASFSFPVLPTIPTVNFQNTSPISVESQIVQILGQDKALWQVNLTRDDAVVSTLKVPKISLINHLLPEGLEIKENYVVSPGLQSLSALIILPQKDIYLSIVYNSDNQEVFKNTLSKLIPAIYWSQVHPN